MSIKITKLSTGKIKVEDGQELRYFEASKDLGLSQNGEAVGVYDGGRLIYDFWPEEVSSTQIEGEALQPFKGDALDLLEILGDSFFFEVATGGGAGAAAFKYLIDSGVFHTLQGDVSPNIGQGAQGTTLVAQLIKPSGNFTINNISINIISTVAGAAVVGIYSLDGDGYPKDKIVQTTEFNTNISGLQSITISPTLLTGGSSYAVVFQCSAPIPNMRRFGYLSTNTGLIWGTDAGLTKYGLLNIANTYSSLLPNQFPAGAALNAQPLIGIYFQ